MKKLNELTIEELKEITQMITIDQFKELLANDNIIICTEQPSFYRYRLLLRDDTEIEINVCEN